MTIYLLRDPHTRRVRYVGVALAPKRRFNDHLREARRGRTGRGGQKSYSARWIYTLLAEGQQPTLEVIEPVKVEDWAERERYWIAYYRALGEPLTNLTAGGEGTLGHRQSRAVRRKHSTARLNYFKLPGALEQHSRSLLGHIVADETKDKIARKATGRKVSAVTRRKHRAQMVQRNQEYEALTVLGQCANAACRKTFQKQQEHQRYCSRRCCQKVARDIFRKRWGHDGPSRNAA